MGARSVREARMAGAATGYLVVALVPLFVVLLDHGAPERGFWVEFAVALGFIGLAMLCLQSILTARFPSISAALGQDTLLQYHRQAGLVAFGFVLAHPAILLVAERDTWAFLDPRDQFLRAVFLIFVLVALPVLVVTALWREQLRLPYEWWRLSHGVLAVAVVGIGLVHIVRVHFYLSSTWKQLLWVAMGTVAIASVAYVRLVKPRLVGRHPYRVTDVVPAAARTWTVTVEPERGPALDFRAGQFAFLTIAESPFALEQHPFSIASSARRTDAVEFSIKELGDFTSTIGTVRPGARAFLDGPYGSLQLPGDDAGIVMVAGGIGVTPMIAMLRTMRDERRSAPAVLVYAGDTIDELAYLPELDRLCEELDLRVVPVLREPPSGWTGEVGVVTPDLIAAHLPPGDPGAWHYLLCGPAPMMEAAEQALLDHDVPLRRIESERFDIGAAGEVGRRHVRIRRSVVALGAVMVAAAALFASAG